MKIFGFEIRKFEQQNTTIQMVETWVVKWAYAWHWFQNNAQLYTNMQCFPSKDAAELYAQQLKDARRLLGDKGLWVEVYKQETPTNAN